jgi:hypothetical protein
MRDRVSKERKRERERERERERRGRRERGIQREVKLGFFESVSSFVQEKGSCLGMVAK